MKKITLEQMIRDTDSLTFLNALKTLLAELKEELAILEETREYQNQAVERARKIMRRVDNQYRGVVKSTAKIYHPPEIVVNPNMYDDTTEETDDE